MQPGESATDRSTSEIKARKRKKKLRLLLVFTLLLAVTLSVLFHVRKDRVAGYAPDCALTPGMHVFFGNYPLNSDNPEPIEWIVLDNDGETALLLAVYAIECLPFNDELADVSWEQCALRQWLGEAFYMKAFSEKERMLIANSVNPNIKIAYSSESDKSENVVVPRTVTLTPNRESFEKMDGSTHDKVFCLSESDINNYFSSDKERMVKIPNRMSMARNYRGFSWYWLRTRGLQEKKTVSVRSDGSINTKGSYVNVSDIVVRPAIRIVVKNV